ncbi:FAD binding domain-containing protein [Megalodesulfovibrio gigas]|uniref:Putative xanthine dehydrogenase FAD binding subunit n=1 Tax=Megalodesulfovibrio gigas (strain ATCC 19364 / DSM 1382 / NCIMB 9332 / VKM B-1759) TaxID=1121448 RepID=T2GD30_MEGG1|nr:FAD binding domain-containing protein [Megalodesulfovibrio gigas]AGW14208.1 putative xanthine dehydrogenase FAD binding subunit [Megalodesulfovibrio gigas DSM 1382 = ATCC 19364]
MSVAIRAVHRPATLAALWPLLADGVCLMAGGTDLLARASGAPLGDVALLEGVCGLAEISQEAGWLRLGAMATHARLLGHPLIAARLPVLAQALAVLGAPAIRTMGTLGGNLVTASPAGDSLPPLLALNALVELASRSGVRQLPLAAFLLGPGRTALAPGEIVTAVLVPPQPEAAVHHFEKVGRRAALAIAVASLAAVVVRDTTGVVIDARLAVGSLGPTALRCTEAEACLCGRRLDRDSLQAAGEAIRAAISPIDDIRATADHRRRLAGNLPLRLTVCGMAG